MYINRLILNKHLYKLDLNSQSFAKKALLSASQNSLYSKPVSHADVVITHMCNMNCPFCIDKFRGQSTNIVSADDVEKFLQLLARNTYKTKKFAFDKNPVTEVLLLGGEPTTVPAEHLNKIAKLVHKYGFQICISTNGKNRQTIEKIMPNFDWVQITCRSDKEIDSWRKYKNKVNVKLAGDKSLTLDKFKHFVEYTKDFPRRSLSMYFKPNFEEVCQDKALWDLLNKQKWEEQGSYLYTFINGVRVKRGIAGKTNIIEEPLVPKLYPDGSYNKTWLHEINDPYLGEI